jgi:hypothetical protein
MKEYLWRVGIKPEYAFMKAPKPVYCVAVDADSARKYVEEHLISPSKTGKISKLGKALGMKMFSGE